MPVPESIPVLNPSDLLTPSQLCKRLKVRRSWLYNQRRRGRKHKIPAIRLGGRLLRYHWPDVSEWLASQSERRGRA